MRNQNASSNELLKGEAKSLKRQKGHNPTSLPIALFRPLLYPLGSKLRTGSIFYSIGFGFWCPTGAARYHWWASWWWIRSTQFVSTNWIGETCKSDDALLRGANENSLSWLRYMMDTPPFYVVRLGFPPNRAILSDLSLSTGWVL